MDLLGIYLNDHLAGSAAGLELFRRAARNHAGSEAGRVLQRLVDEVDQERKALLALMDTLGVPAQRPKLVLAWVAEKAARLKPNGRLFRRSPLSSVVELESLRLGVQGKALGWALLRTLADYDHRLDPDQLDELRKRAEQQGQIIEELRLRAAVAAFATRQSA